MYSPNKHTVFMLVIPIFFWRFSSWTHTLQETLTLCDYLIIFVSSLWRRNVYFIHKQCEAEYSQARASRMSHLIPWCKRKEIGNKNPLHTCFRLINSSEWEKKKRKENTLRAGISSLIYFWTEDTSCVFYQFGRLWVPPGKDLGLFYLKNKKCTSAKLLFSFPPSPLSSSPFPPFFFLAGLLKCRTADGFSATNLTAALWCGESGQPPPSLIRGSWLALAVSHTDASTCLSRC